MTLKYVMVYEKWSIDYLLIQRILFIFMHTASKSHVLYKYELAIVFKVHLILL